MVNFTNVIHDRNFEWNCYCFRVLLLFLVILGTIGLVLGLGIGMTRDCSLIMIGQYFKKKREFVEMLTVAGSGLGIIFISVTVRRSIDTFGWRWVRQFLHFSSISSNFLAFSINSKSEYSSRNRHFQTWAPMHHTHTAEHIFYGPVLSFSHLVSSTATCYSTFENATTQSQREKSLNETWKTHRHQNVTQPNRSYHFGVIGIQRVWHLHTNIAFSIECA